MVYERYNIINSISKTSTCLLLEKPENIYLLVLNYRIRDKKEVIVLSISEGEINDLENAVKNKDFELKYHQSSFSADWVKSW